MIEASAATGWYVYGVAETHPGLERLSGVECVGHGPLTALVREVPLDEFGEDALPGHLNDPKWLERNAWAHEEILQAAAALTVVVPLRFGTIYRSRDQVEHMLRERAEQFGSTLERVRGHVELGVKAWIDLATLEGTLGSPEDPAAAGTGAAYLQRRRREQEITNLLRVRCSDLAAEAHRRLTAVAIDAVANRPQSRELTCRSETMLLNGAYLVPESDERLRGEVERLASEHAALGVEYELTGPWPPHNFAEDAA